MNIPQKAIIVVNTPEENRRLADFLGLHIGKKVRSNACDGECVDLDLMDGTEYLGWADRDWYEAACDVYDRGESSFSGIKLTFIPDDPLLRFISVDDFIAFCHDEILDCSVEVGDLL